MILNGTDVVAIITVAGVIAQAGIVWWRVGELDKQHDKLEAKITAIERSRQEQMLDDLRDAERRRDEQ